ncbi:MAG: hypothetical protein L6264_11560 [Weeksellaceae bacterium]|nr:hypothetical protein [Bacteroidota bacterium]MCG2781574.1 hypothetical protein [Weeksellaceae bacterium]
MFGIVLAVLLLVFGIFLRTTKDPGFAGSKRFSWFFIIGSVLSLIGKLVIMYQKGEL